jgi:hypothetical protein
MGMRGTPAEREVRGGIAGFALAQRRPLFACAARGAGAHLTLAERTLRHAGAVRSGMAESMLSTAQLATPPRRLSGLAARSARKGLA